MVMCQVKFGSVVHNIKEDLYARVVGLVEVDGTIRIQIHRKDKPEDSHNMAARERLNPTFIYWNPEDCEPMTEREKDGSLFLLVPDLTDALDREV